MSVQYVGYGFNTNDISDETWMSLFKKYNPKEFQEIENKMNKDSDACKEAILNAIDTLYNCTADYLRDIINTEESKKHNIKNEDVVITYDNFLVFDSIRFPGECKRCEFIRTQDDFIKMIAKYIPTEKITFGNLWDGNDWEDSSFFIE